VINLLNRFCFEWIDCFEKGTNNTMLKTVAQSILTTSQNATKASLLARTIPQTCVSAHRGRKWQSEYWKVEEFYERLVWVPKAEDRKKMPLNPLIYTDAAEKTIEKN